MQESTMNCKAYIFCNEGLVSYIAAIYMRC